MEARKLKEELRLAGLNYEIIETIGVISKSPKGWQKELNLIAWNNREPKYDLRDWSPDHEKMGKGVTLTKQELERIKILLNDKL